MPSNTFISYDHDDQQQVAGFRLLKDNPKHPLDFQDHSLKDEEASLLIQPGAIPGELLLGDLCSVLLDPGQFLLAVFFALPLFTLFTLAIRCCGLQRWNA